MRSTITREAAAAGATARLCDPCVDEAWTELADRAGTLFHSTPWLRVLRDAYRLRPVAVLSTGSGGAEPAGAGLAFVELADARGRRVVSLPFSDVAGPLGPVDHEGLSPLMGGQVLSGAPLRTRVRPATDGAPERGAIEADDDDRFRTCLDLTETGRLAWHWAELPLDADGGGGDSDPLWQELASGARQNVRRSRRSGVQVEVRSDLGALGEYYRLHHGLRKAKYRLLAQPWSFFTALHRHFGPDRLRVVLARLDDAGPGSAPVAGVVLLRHGDWAYYKLNASDEASWPVRANDAVMWEAMVTARRWGCRWFDFGVSDLDQPGLVRYKRKYATGEAEVVALQRSGGPPSWTARQIDRALPVVTRALTAPHSPDGVGRQASRALYRLFA